MQYNAPRIPDSGILDAYQVAEYSIQFRYSN